MWRKCILAAMVIVIVGMAACSEPVKTFPDIDQITVRPRTPTPILLVPLLEIQSFRCTTDSQIGFVYIRGEVKNISNGRLDHVMAVGTWRTSAGEFIRSDDALIDYDPIMPGQISPFETIGTYNPQMSKCSLAFKELLGGEIPTTKR